MVHREEHNESYTVIDNAVLQNVNLSFEARGFLCYLLSLPNDWTFTVRGIVKQTGCSKSVILIEKACKVLSIPREEIGAYFFKPDVDFCQQKTT